MSEHDAALYAKLRGQVQRPIQTIRVILDSLQVVVGMGPRGGGGGGGHVSINHVYTTAWT